MNAYLKYPMSLLAMLTITFCSMSAVSCSEEENRTHNGYNPDIPDVPGNIEEHPRYIRIVAIAKPFTEKKGEWVLTKERGLAKDYTAQDIIEMVQEMRPHRIERILTGYADENMQVPVREGEAPMTLLRFLDEVMAAGEEGCDIAPKLDLSWLKNEKQAQFFWDSAQKLYDMPLKNPIRVINLDCWNAYIDEIQPTEEECTALFKKLRDIGYEEIGVNMTGHVNDNHPEIDYVVFTLKKDTWTVNTTALEKVKSWPNVKKIFQYIDYPEPFTTFFTTLTPDQQADVYYDNVVALQDEIGFLYAWPILQGAWDATAYKTSDTGKYGGKTIYEIFKDLMYE